MFTLYPEIEPNRKYYLDTNTTHKVYYEESGNPSGIPVIFLHGGPGSGSNENHRRYFNPDQYRIINFDQRGCNRSTPVGEVKNNTTQDLLQDIESIRQSLNIDKWGLFGGSWGATLGLLYAQAYPQTVMAMVLRGCFLARPCDLEWFLGKGANRIFPDAWDRFISYIPDAERNDLMQAYYCRLTSDNPDQVVEAARHWADWTGRVVTYLLDIEEFVLPDDMTSLISETRIETHYGAHSYFIESNQVLENLDIIPSVPIKVIHGRRDLTCTLDASWDLHHGLPQSNLMIVEQGGHLAAETVMVDALIKATDTLAQSFT
ncbi:MAG: prolyl aminopeptidase [Gammaproteobacteria bacterium]|nr:prolyl aminopeptidase [Gammaproteobacteria bacterium]